MLNRMMKRFLDGNLIGFSLETRTVSHDNLDHCYLRRSGMAKCGSDFAFGVYVCFEI